MSASTEPDLEHEDQEEQLQGQMSFFDHLEELRKRIISILITVAVTFGISWYFVDYLFVFTMRPLEKLGISAHIINITDNFNVPFKICVTSAIFLAAPLIMRQVWLFIAPALYKHERRYAFPFLISSAVLFFTGGAFGYYIAFPAAVEFLTGFGTKMRLVQTLNAMEYFDLFLMFEVILGFIFEIPAVIFILSRFGIVSGPFLLRNFRYAILISSILAAVLTPTTDIPNMMMVGVPMIMLYAVGIVVAYIFGKKRPPDE